MKNDYSREMREPPRANNLKTLRKNLRQTQTEFWQRFGVTQSRGSRFEKGLCLPPPVAILIELYVEKKVNDADLMTALRNSGGVDHAEPERQSEELEYTLEYTMEEAMK